ncbi:hypothetical protein [Vulcanisaeta souniana]|uniref:hypothetical protein n=1 Tax=Vulcanisaeta souniana TaxID=164452 RepID=UPI001FB2976D|nr:hypothetical protein [Vulcanisaeta souniana]
MGMRPCSLVIRGCIGTTYISHRVLGGVFLNVGFILKEEVIKIQHRMKTTREVWQRMRAGGASY